MILDELAWVHVEGVAALQSAAVEILAKVVLLAMLPGALLPDLVTDVQVVVTLAL